MSKYTSVSIFEWRMRYVRVSFCIQPNYYRYKAQKRTVTHHLKGSYLLNGLSENKIPLLTESKGDRLSADEIASTEASGRERGREVGGG